MCKFYNRSILSLSLITCFRDLSLQVVAMEDVVSFDKTNKIRTVVLADNKVPVNFVQLSAWNVSRDVFASSTGTSILSSSPDWNSEAFLKLIVSITKP